MGTLRFVLRADKADSKGRQPVELIYSLYSQRKYYRTKEKLLPGNWDQDNQVAIYLDKKKAKQLLPGTPFDELPTARDIQTINNNLNDLRARIDKIEKRFELDQRPYSSADVLYKLKIETAPATIKDEPTDLVFDFIDQYIEDHKAFRVPGSLSVYKALKRHLSAFQKEKKMQVAFSNIDTTFFKRFQAFLVTPRAEIIKGKLRTVSLTNVTVAKQLSTLKTFLNYAKASGIKVSDQYRDFKIKKEKLEVISLTNQEFETLFNMDLSGNKRLDQTRDIFCFACATGLRYSDLNQLRREHIKAEELKINVKKTRTDLTVPLNPYSKAILEKYKDRHFPLPVSTNQKLISNPRLNLYVKELCKLAGFDDSIEIVRFKGDKREATVYPKYELITVHTGRKTFCTVSLERGMTAEEVMRISGHENYESFKRYVNITEQRKRESMNKAWGSFLPDTNLVKNTETLKAV